MAKPRLVVVGSYRGGQGSTFMYDERLRAEEAADSPPAQRPTFSIILARRRNGQLELSSTQPWENRVHLRHRLKEIKEYGWSVLNVTSQLQQPLLFIGRLEEDSAISRLEELLHTHIEQGIAPPISEEELYSARWIHDFRTR